MSEPLFWHLTHTHTHTHTHTQMFLRCVSMATSMRHRMCGVRGESSSNPSRTCICRVVILKRCISSSLWYIFVYVCVCKCVYVCIYVCMHTCMRICMSCILSLWGTNINLRCSVYFCVVIVCPICARRCGGAIDWHKHGGDKWAARVDNKRCKPQV